MNVGTSMRHTTLGLMLVPFLLLVAACGGDDDGSPLGAATATSGGSESTPTASPGETATPGPVLGLFVADPTTGIGTQALAGTSCLSNKCVDYIGPVTSDEPVTFTAGADLGWQVEGGTAVETSVAWVPNDEATVEDGGDGTLVWKAGDLVYSESDRIVVPEEPGDYLLSIFMRYASGDDVTWGVYVHVE